MIEKDFIFVCQRCQGRLKRKEDLDVAFEWTDESFKKMKKEFFQDQGRKPAKPVVLTTCLGFCPEGRVSLVETKEGQLGLEESYPYNASYSEIKTRLMK